MRARTTAAALLGALALVLPTAGATVAADHDDDDGRRPLGRLEYLVDDDDEVGGDEHRQIRPADNDTCYRLTGTSWENPATTVRNETESLAVLFRDRECGERAERVLAPGERAHGVQVRSVLFKPVDDEDDEGRHDGRNDGWNNGRHDGNDDESGNGDEDRGRRREAGPGLPGAPVQSGAKPAVQEMVKPPVDEPAAQPADGQPREDQPREEQAREEQAPQEQQARDEQARDEQAREEQAQREELARQEEMARQDQAQRDEQARMEQQAREEQDRREEEQGRTGEQGPDMFDRIFGAID
ncbi:hypothetical protein [Streptomyces sp. NPDC046161]|uniref:hypothetical protein n=1 Tax=Streptomyces sp. NPDC046161 TaxID=3155132 RepID=UPI0033CA7FD8